MEQQLTLLDSRLQQEIAQPLPKVVIDDPPEPEGIAMPKKPFAILQGLYTIIRMPTEERLTVRFENLSKDNFERIVSIAEAYMKDVDYKYRVKTNRGRSWRGTGIRIAEVSERTVRFSPFPSSTLNMFKTLRKLRSDAYHRHCIVLERQEEHTFQNNINILPYANAPDFVLELREMNKMIDEANQKIEEFQQMPEWENLCRTLEPYGVSDYLKSQKWTVEHCTLITTEIALETATVRQHIEDEYRKMFTEIDEEKAKALEAVHEEFEKGQRSIAQQALESLQREMAELVKRVVSASKRKPERVKADLERLRRKIVSIGLDALEPTVNQLIQVFDNPEKMLELFGTQNLEQAVDGRIKGLIDSL